jgi:dTMP kinase
MQRGFIIEIEGINGAGKTTLTKQLYNDLKLKGYPVELVREPGGSSVAERIRDIAVDDTSSSLSELSGLFLYMASRSQLIYDKVEKYLSDGKIVIYDRCEDSTRVYQGVMDNLGITTVDSMLKTFFSEYKPRVTILLDVEPTLGVKRANKDGVEINKYDRKPLEFYEKAREAYLSIFGERIKTDEHCYILDSNRDKSIVYEELLNVVEKEINDLDEC